MYAVITGAADGIGWALAERYLAAGHAVLGIDQDVEKSDRRLRAAAARGGRLDFLIEDLSRPDAAAAVVESLAAGPEIDLVVHCAGDNRVGPFGAVDLEAQRRLLCLNLETPTLITAGLLARSKIAPGGTLIFVASLSVYLGYPGAATYAATKAGLAALARSLGVALADGGMNVITAFPGPTRTEHARRHAPPESGEDHRMSAGEVADQIMRAARKRRRTVIPGWRNRLGAVLGVIAPKVTEWALRKAIWDKLPSAKEFRVDR